MFTIGEYALYYNTMQLYMYYTIHHIASLENVQRLGHTVNWLVVGSFTSHSIFFHLVYNRYFTIEGEGCILAL